MQEGVVLAVDVGHEMLGALGQVQNGLEPDDLRGSVLDRGILLGKQAQIAKLFRREGLFVGHIETPLHGR